LEGQPLKLQILCNSSSEGAASLHRMSTLQIPTIGFLYVAGYIGHVGRGYIIKVKEEAKPTDKEIILDVPLALKLAFQGWAWPLAAIQVSRSRGVCS